MVILALINAYLPGYKAGGPIQSVANLAECLGDEFQIKIITSDRDCGDSDPYPSVKPGEWQRVGKAEVLYLGPGGRSLWSLRRIINSTEYDILYLNSFFNPIFTLFPLLLAKGGLIRSTPVVVAPRGELSPGALQLKGVRKRSFLAVAGMLGLYKGVLWQASSALEAADIQNWIPTDAKWRHRVVVAPDLPCRERPGENRPSKGKRSGHLRLLFASRITPKKNLLGALRCLDRLQGAIQFDICGPVDDFAYWSSCSQVIKTLPPNVNVCCRGPVAHEEVMREMSQHDLFFLPTLSENFGHAIVESMAAGCPVLISEATPWRSLESARAGWDLPVEQLASFRSVLQRCIDMDESEHRIWREGARKLAGAAITDDATIKMNRELFVQALTDQERPQARSQRRDSQGAAADLSRRHFDSIAAQWERKYQPGGSLYRRASLFVECLQASVASSARVLDFGCGSGDIAMACRCAGYRISGIDISPAMIARARLRSYGQGIYFEVLDCGDPLVLPYPDSYFDAIIASSVLEYVPDLLHCLEELRRVCTPNGIMIATVPNVRHPQRWLEVVLRQPAVRACFRVRRAWKPYAEYLSISKNRFQQSDWLNLFAQCGWHMESLQGEHDSLAMLVARRGSLRQTQLARTDSGHSQVLLQVQK